jgi:hypothetical protein
MMPPALEPAAPGADAFVDALLGLDRLCGWLGEATDAALGDVVASGELPMAPSDGDDVLDAVLGLASLRTTLSLVLRALASQPADLAEEPAAGWSRELLR